MNASAQRFDSVSESFAKSEVHKQSPTMARFAELLGKPQSLNVCDIACGPGHFGFFLTPFAQTLVGIDPSPNMLSQFREMSSKFSLPIEHRLGTAEDLPAKTSEFDLTVSRLAPHHFTNIERAVQEMARVTKPGGHVGIIDLQGADNPHSDTVLHVLEMLHDPTHVRAYRAQKWKGFLEAAGFEIRHCEGKHSEKPGGIPISKWCDIAKSGKVAELAINEFLSICADSDLAELGITKSNSTFFYPVRTVLLIARRK